MPRRDALLVSDTDYLPVLLRLLDHARLSVDILAYSFAIGSAAGKLNEGSAPFQIAQKLVDLKREKPKVRVRLYIEGERETADRNAVTVRLLEEHGVEVVCGATHAKGFCLDDRYVLLGSTNLTQQSVMKNNETNLLFDDEEVAEGFEAYFAHLWGGGRHGGIELAPPLYADGAFQPMLLDLIDGAKKSVHFSIYFFDQKDTEKALIRAHERGVKVTGFLHNHTAFAMPYVRRTRRTAKRLLEAGITDLHYGPTHLFSHSKWLVQDRKIIALGTGNWLDEDIEIHPQLYVEWKSPALAKDLLGWLTVKIKRTGTPLSAWRGPA
ncbi:MAG TPA: phospholipase D-like domain-containing protein [Polyangiaceae bacterium]|jgi:phosphatidylserine/phosphatidylglycerophosphate/cardiolipin synthase-like enzyme|nr:phospholipase D-like domain-containing protein [Polyangiaceae bacterium]